MPKNFKLDMFKQHNYADGTTSTEKEATMYVSKNPINDEIFFALKGKKGEVDMWLTTEESKKLIKYLIDVIC
jgi:hypothetical protein